MKIFLVGNFGVGNAGDEAILEYYLERFSEYEWVWTSAHPSQNAVAFLPAGLRSFFSLRWIRTLSGLRTCDAVVFGGGTLFTDNESVHACFIWFVHALAAHIFHKPLLLAFQGIGPIRSRFGQWCARFAVRSAQFLSVRDTASLLEVQRLSVGKLGKKSTECVQTFDPSILLLDRQKPDLRTNNVYMIVPRLSTGWISKHLVNLQKNLNKISLKIISMHPSDKQEQKLCMHLSDMLEAPIIRAFSLPQIQEVMTDATGMFSQRYHGCLVALAAGIPFCAIVLREGDKLSALAKECNCPSMLLESALQTSWQDHDWKHIQQTMLEQRERLIVQAQKGEDALRDCLKKIDANTLC